MEVISPVLQHAVLRVDEILDESGEPVEIANRVKQILHIKTDLNLENGDLLRIRI